MENGRAPVIASDIQLEAITGPMFSGKTEELMRRLNTCLHAGLKVIVIRPSTDTRSVGALTSHGNYIWKGPQEFIPPDKPERALNIVLDGGYDVAGFDECQFYSSPEIVTTLLRLAYMSKRVIATLLDLDFRGLPYGYAPQIMSVSTLVDRYHAVCSVCKNQATRTQRLNDAHEPVFWNDELTVVGDNKVIGGRYYQARCTQDHIVLNEKGERVVVLDGGKTMMLWDEFVNSK